MTAVYLLALFLSAGRKSLDSAELSELGKELLKLPAKVTEVLASLGQVATLAKKMSEVRTVLFLGRNVGFPVAMEGALKLKELAYIHAEGFAAGELKHGPIALIEQDQPVIVVLPAPQDPLHPKVISNIQEIKARGAKVIAIAEQGDQEAAKYAEEVWFVPATNWLMSPILTVIPLQAFAMELANAKGLDVDQPRNLAKSVTVE
jgi:glucosamine--fructose-6-phosphate aminotransferase (isomerizing)